MTSTEQLKEEIDEILVGLDLYERRATLTPSEVIALFPELNEARIALLTAFNNHVDRCTPEKMVLFGAQNEAGDVSPEDYEAAGFNNAIAEFTANLKGETR